MTTPSPIRVLSVDDSAMFRRVLCDILGNRADIDLVGCAKDAYDARDRLLAESVDVLTLDLEMPRMDGLAFLKLIMDRKPMPVVVVSSQTPTGSQNAVEALIAGAFAVIEKPTDISQSKSFGVKLIGDIKSAAAAPVRRHRPAALSESLKTGTLSASLYHPRQIIALGASTGGTHALEKILMSLPDNLPGILAVQHIPSGFSASFAARLDRNCAMEVREAKDGDELHPGLCLVAPGNQHMEAQWFRDHYRVVLHRGALVEHQRPSVDVLFDSLAACAGAHTVAALLTGMGRDGAQGMKRLHDLQAYTIAQDAGSSVVYGMARRAVELQAVDAIVPLEKIAGEIMKNLETNKARTTPKNYAL